MAKKQTEINTNSNEILIEDLKICHIVLDNMEDLRYRIYKETIAFYIAIPTIILAMQKLINIENNSNNNYILFVLSVTYLVGLWIAHMQERKDVLYNKYLHQMYNLRYQLFKGKDFITADIDVSQQKKNIGGKTVPFLFIAFIYIINSIIVYLLVRKYMYFSIAIICAGVNFTIWFILLKINWKKHKVVYHQ